MSASKFDYIVVGGGSAGSIAAFRLAENTAFDVLLIDAGSSPADIPDVWNPYDNNNLYEMPDIWWQHYKSPKYAGSKEMVDVCALKFTEAAARSMTWFIPAVLRQTLTVGLLFTIATAGVIKRSSRIFSILKNTLNPPLEKKMNLVPDLLRPVESKAFSISATTTLT